MTAVIEPADPRSLVGQWRFERVVTDRLADEVIEVDGVVEFSLADEGSVRWAEQGTMHRAGVDLPVSRELVVVHRDDGWMVTFADGRDFHPWSPGTQVVHLCGDDTYVGLVERDVDGPRWQVRWQATGPRKDYEILTRLAPA